MLELWETCCNGLFDVLLGWLLGLSWTATLVVVAVLTGMLLALVRKVGTDQSLLGRAAADRKRLKQLIRDAKKRRDKPAVERFQTTRSMIAMRTLPQEALPLLLVIVPVAMLATWCFNRLGYRPPRGGEGVEVVFYAPVSAVGEVMHLVPESGLTADRWVQPIELGEIQRQPTGLAWWTVRAQPRRTPYRLTFRFRGRTFDRGELLVGQVAYAPPLAVDEREQIGVKAKLREARLFGVVPGLGEMFPPWVVAYLVLVIPLAVVTKRLLRIH